MKYKFENVRGFKNRKLKQEDIILIQGDENYSVFHLINGTKFTLSKTLKQCEGIFEDFNFVRSHRSYIVNVIYSEKLVESEVFLKNNLKAKVSRRRKATLLEHLSILKNTNKNLIVK